MPSSLIKEQLNSLPNTPGVYLMKDAGKNIVYVGKAVNLRNRVRSYFRPMQNLTPKTRRMVSRVADIDFFITASEQEALVLELNLIKRYHPFYNVRLKDDKTFPYLKIDIDEQWPRLYSTHRLEEDGGLYFGPFTNSRSVRQTIKVLKGIFPFRSCKKPLTGTQSRACLDYHIGRCLGPCIGAVSRQEYHQMIKEVILFLEGKQEKIIREMEKRMRKMAEVMEFEKAAALRDQIQALREVITEQKISARVRGEQDAIAFVQDKDQSFVQVFFIRNSKLTGRESFVLQGTRYEKPSAIMESFIKQFYDSSPHVPPLLLLQHHIEDTAILKGWLQTKRDGAVNIQVPRRGSRKQLMDTVAENARQGLEQLKIKQMAAPKSLDAALAEVQKELNLPGLPVRMEAYDISNIQGTSAVGSMVVFENGKPKSAQYRRFRIKTVSGADDYAMMHEVLKRRFKHITEDTSSGTGWAVIPDLVLIDGGKGQLNAALDAMAETGADAVPVASLAKENEEIYLPGKAKPVILSRSSPALQLLQRLRDEAHRFAIGYFQKVHRRETFASVFDNIAGIGPHRKRALIRQFGSPQAVREASLEEIAATSGMNLALAKKVKESL